MALPDITSLRFQSALRFILFDQKHGIFLKLYLFALFGSSDYSCTCQKIGKDFLSVHKLLNVE